MFALLVALTEGKALAAPEIEAAMTGTDTPPDQTLKEILDAFKQAETEGVEWSHRQSEQAFETIPTLPGMDRDEYPPAVFL